MGLKDQIALEEAELAKLGITVEGDEEEGGEDDTPPAKKKQEKQTSEDDEGAGDGDDAKEDDKKGEKQPKKGDDDKEGDAAPGTEGKKPAKKEGEDDENNTAAQLRIERKQRKELQAKLDALQRGEGVAAPAKPIQTPVAKAEEGAEGQAKGPTAEERLEVIEREREQQKLEREATDEFLNYENEFKKEAPDYAQASSHMVGSMMGAVQAIYPNASEKQVALFVRQQLLHLAGQAVQRGLNPAEALYLMAHEKYGYKKAAPKTDNTRERLATVQKNQKRSASPLAGGGQNGSPSATLEEAADMSLADFSRLKPGEIEAMINDAQG